MSTTRGHSLGKLSPAPLLLLAVVCAASFLSGCGGGSANEDVPTLQLPEPDYTPKKGGSIRAHIRDWPENLRIYGTASNTFLNSIIESLAYETLVNLNSNTLEFEPALAEKWSISEDKITFTFHLNPKARWSDGTPVTAKDVLATYNLLDDETLLAPMSHASIVDKMYPPVVKSDHEFEVRCKLKHWRNFISLVSMSILPAHQIESLSGKDYLDKYNHLLTAVSGPYNLEKKNIKDNQSITLTRRKDYWAIDEPVNTGKYNFDEITFVVIAEDHLAFQKACRGELDFYPVYTSKWWVKDLPSYEAFKLGHLVRQKVFTKFPQSTQGFALNTRKAPLDDVNVRKAIAHLFDRKTMIEKFAYNEYTRLKSYYPAGDGENPKNKMIEYDPREAVRLLEASGWTEKGTDGIRLKNGKRLTFAISYDTKFFEKYFTKYKEDAKKAGVEITLRKLTPETRWKNVVEDRKFQMSNMAWKPIMFPDPRPNFHSSMAGKNGSNNITGYRNEKIDKLIDKYDAEFDLEKRNALLRQIDAELYAEHHYVQMWSSPSERIVYWNKFGMPKNVLPKYGDYRDVYTTWWVDVAKAEKLQEARKNGLKLVPLPRAEVREWITGDAKPEA